MQLSRRRAVAVLTMAALAGSGATAVTAAGHDGGKGAQRGDRHGDHRGKALLETTVAPSVPTDPMLNGAAAGGAPWVIKRGEAVLTRKGELIVSVRGLVIPVAPANGTPGPVTTVFASLYCGGSSTATGSTASVPISTAGDAFMQGSVTVPAKCLAPTVLVHPNGIATIYIAASGFGG
jgi:hypothetical protein